MIWLLTNQINTTPANIRLKIGKSYINQMKFWNSTKDSKGSSSNIVFVTSALSHMMGGHSSAMVHIDRKVILRPVTLWGQTGPKTGLSGETASCLYWYLFGAYTPAVLGTWKLQWVVLCECWLVPPITAFFMQNVKISMTVTLNSNPNRITLNLGWLHYLTGLDIVIDLYNFHGLLSTWCFHIGAANTKIPCDTVINDFHYETFSVLI
jgi:hypothetical protein